MKKILRSKEWKSFLDHILVLCKDHNIYEFKSSNCGLIRILDQEYGGYGDEILFISSRNENVLIKRKGEKRIAYYNDQDALDELMITIIYND